ncbi:MAG: OmpA family protein, partial [Alphaproteobacteria bacterium]
GTYAAQAEQRPAGHHYPEIKEMRLTHVRGNEFDDHLAREYQDLSAFESDEMFDWRDAERYAGRANAAASHKAVYPYVPTDWRIVGKDNMTALVDARAKLVSALNRGGRTLAPKEAAIAQAKYDCWVEQQEEGHQPDHIAACRAEFDAAYAALLAAMPAMSEEIARETVYFAFDSSAISAGEQAEINEFVAAMKPMANIVLHVVGHADRSGSSAYNQKLSHARAVAVRSELVRQGMNVAAIASEDLKAAGEDAPAVATADGVKEARNRRVEIIAKGVVTK